MMQDAVFAKLLAADSGAARGVGFLARFLICHPPSTMGTRTYRERDAENAGNAAFDTRVRELLDLFLPVADDGMALDPPVLSLSTSAKSIWIDFYNDIESATASDGEFASTCDFAAKAAENAVRLAAVFHVFEHGPHGEISADMMQRGATVAAWHLHETRRIIESLGTPQSALDAQALLYWFRKENKQEATLTELAKRAPYALRDTKRRNSAIDVLCERGHARQTKQSGGTVVLINPKSLEAVRNGRA
jgi:hypothetical protein